eukprot:gene29233-32802_t
MPALDLLVRMQATRTHMALVIDEYGGTDGLVSLEDIVEMIVGDIEDEHDVDESPKIETGADGSIVADARAALEDIGATLGEDLASMLEDEEVHTLGGLVTALAGRVPVRGEIVPSNGGFEFEVLDADPRRVKRVKIIRRSPDSSSKPDNSGSDPAGSSKIPTTRPPDWRIADTRNMFGMMDALAGRVILSSGWERRLTAYFCGAFGALAMAPFDLLPAVLVPMCAAVWLIDGSVTRHEGSRSSGILPTLASAAAAGWWLGFGFFTAGLWWIGTAFLVEADQFAWALPIAVLGLPALLAVFTALGFTLSALIWSTGWSRVLALAVGLGGAEFARAHVLTGFPWNEWGMALGGNLVFAQAAAIIGIHGLTLITIV